MMLAWMLFGRSLIKRVDWKWPTLDLFSNPYFLSFRRKPESRHTGFTPLLWIPVFAGMTVPEQLYFVLFCQNTSNITIVSILTTRTVLVATDLCFLLFSTAFFAHEVPKKDVVGVATDVGR